MGFNTAEQGGGLASICRSCLYRGAEVINIQGEKAMVDIFAHTVNICT